MHSNFTLLCARLLAALGRGIRGMMSGRHGPFLRALMVAAMFAPGCTTGRRNLPPATPDVREPLAAPHASEEKHDVTTNSAGPTRIRPGLILNVMVLVNGEPEFPEVARRVSDAGTITLPLVGSIPASGSTLAELNAQLNEAYNEYYVRPQVFIDYARDNGDETLAPWGYATVMGRVKHPGRVAIPATRDLTLSVAIQLAGGLDTSAKETAIRISHGNSGGGVDSKTVDLRAIGAAGKLRNDIVLQPGDVVFVPELRF